MEKSLVKNFILLLLALVNLFLGVIVVEEVRDEKSVARFQRAALEDVLESNGIRLSHSVALPEDVPPQLYLRRDSEAEKRLISALLGSSEWQDLGGNVYHYQGKNGEAWFRGTGEFEILLNADAVAPRREPEAIAKAALKKLGLEVSDSPTISGENGETLTYLVSYNGTTVRNAQLSFSFTSDYQVTIHGTRPLDIREGSQSSEHYPDGASVLMSLLDAVHEKGIVCSEISDLKVEYYMSPAVSGSCTLRPIWHIGTDSGIYYFDAETTRAEQFEGSL